MSTTTTNLGLFKYNIDTDSHLAFNINQALNDNWDIIDEFAASGGTGASRNIGEIVASTIPLTDAGLHLLDGSLINGSGSYSSFVNHIAGLVNTYPNCFTTENDWQSSISSYGACGKFVYNSINNTVRLPKITGIIEGTTDVTALSDLVEAGLPNITGSIKNCMAYYSSQIANSGALYTSTRSGTKLAGATSSSVTSENDLYINASRSSSIYGKSNTVQPQTIKMLYYIVIATSTKTEIEVDIDEIATDLNGKVDKANLVEAHCIIESYQNGSSWYRIYSDGWCEQGASETITSSTSATAKTIIFLKEFKDTNYIVLYQPTTSFANDMDSRYSTVKTKTTSSFSVGYSCTCNWQASGYIN